MEVIAYPPADASAASAAPPQGCVATIGAYDGVHRGHQALIAEVRAVARGRGCASAVVTFDRHPASVVRPGSAPRLLTDLAQKLELLAETGLDYAVVVRFDEARARESAEEFVSEVLVRGLRARAVVVGSDFHFGKGRRGNVELLRRMGAELGFEVVAFDLVAADGGPPVSSTAVRRALDAGEIEAAAALLGRPYEVRGRVTHGDRRGRGLGFPTANVEVPPEVLVPADGVYAGWYQRAAGAVSAAAISVGRRPTFHDGAGPAVLEAYVLDFEGDLYGEEARVRFLGKLRDQVRFESPELLADQIGRDVEATRALT